MKNLLVAIIKNVSSSIFLYSRTEQNNKIRVVLEVTCIDNRFLLFHPVHVQVRFLIENQTAEKLSAKTNYSQRIYFI